MRSKAVVLLSGGLDSVTCLAVAKKEGFELHALCFDYGQRHKIEIECARRSAAAIGVEKFHQISFDLRQWGASALTSDQIDVPDFKEHRKKVPITYVPARNLIFLSFGTALAESIGARDIFIGVNSMDYSGYPDCRPPFIEAFQLCAKLGTKAIDEHWEYKIRTPLQNLRKREIIELGLSLGVDYSLTHSCYNPDPDGRPCGHCDSCGLRNNAFAELGMTDPALNRKF
ncbi:MAG: 7-cyano-7-deazaguanine synthase QueC [Lentisphaeria bacterium]|nr:7-cyano-7-deazaguanine synthase QueC [Lentisphaeria bacterium]